MLRPLLLIVLESGYRLNAWEHFDNVSVFTYFLLIYKLIPLYSSQIQCRPRFAVLLILSAKEQGQLNFQSTFHQSVYDTDKRFVEAEGFEPSSKLSAKINSLSQTNGSKVFKKTAQKQKSPNFLRLTFIVVRFYLFFIRGYRCFQVPQKDVVVATCSH